MDSECREGVHRNGPRQQTGQATVCNEASLLPCLPLA